MEGHPELKAITDASGTMLNWALLIAGASIAALVSTSFDRPKTTTGRLFYLLLVPGWFFLGESLYAGFQISQRYIAAIITKNPGVLSSIEEKLNDDFSGQLLFLEIGFGCLALWLLSFLIWFCFLAPRSSASRTEAEKANAERVVAEGAAQRAEEFSETAKRAAGRAEAAQTEAECIAGRLLAQRDPRNPENPTGHA